MAVVAVRKSSCSESSLPLLTVIDCVCAFLRIWTSLVRLELCLSLDFISTPTYSLHQIAHRDPRHAHYLGRQGRSLPRAGPGVWPFYDPVCTRPYLTDCAHYYRYTTEEFDELCFEFGESVYCMILRGMN